MHMMKYVAFAAARLDYSNSLFTSTVPHDKHDKCGAGCMNNTTFGDEGMGYYETVAGGAGAGPRWHGRRCSAALARKRPAPPLLCPPDNAFTMAPLGPQTSTHRSSTTRPPPLCCPAAVACTPT